MSDKEFELLDELYFIISFADLQKTLKWSEADLFHWLQILFEKGWIKLVEPVELSLPPTSDFDISKNPDRYHYLATKEGLKAHTSI